MTLPFNNVAPFPRERFLAFLSRLRIQTKDFGMVPIKLLGTQTYVLDEICRAMSEGVTTIYILKARQLGMTTFFLALDLFWSMEHTGLLGSFATHTDKAKENFRNTIRLFFSQLPKTHKIKWSLENREMLVLTNGSVIQYLVAGTKEKIKGGLGRSSANNFIHATETAFWGSPDDLHELSATMSIHYPHRLWIEETTANGFNFWEERWRDAKDDKTIRCVFVGWWRHDHYFIPDDHPWFALYVPDGHGSRMSILERQRVRRVKERYGVDITYNQIAWYRHHLESELKGDQSKMDEHHPWTEEDAFVATGSQFFVNAALTDAARRARAQKFMPFRYMMGDHWRDTQVIAVKDRNAELRVWEEANPNGHYAIGCDPAYGSSETADRAVINVSRCFADRLVQVAEFVSPTISTYQCAWALCHLAGYYRNVQFLVELNGPGEAVLNEIRQLQRDTSTMVDRTTNGMVTYDLRYVFTMMRHFLYTRADSLSFTPAYHWRMSGKNKSPLLSSFKDSFELKRYVINSMPLLDEMKTVIVDGGEIEAETGKKDDRVIAAGLAHEVWRRYLKSRMAALGITYESAYKADRGEGPDQAQRMAINYLRTQGISMEVHE